MEGATRRETRENIERIEEKWEAARRQRRGIIELKWEERGAALLTSR